MFRLKGKILYAGTVLRGDWPGGEHVEASEVIDHLSRAGYDVVPVYNNLVPWGNLLNSIHGDLRKYGSYEDYNHNAKNHYDRIIDREDPDLVISQYDYDTSVVRSAVDKGKKIIVFVRTWWPICPKTTLMRPDSNRCSGFRANDCFACIASDDTSLGNSVLKIIFREYGKSNSKLKSKMSARVDMLNHPDVHIAVISPHMKDMMVNQGVSPERVSVVEAGVPLNKYKYTSGERPRKVVYLGGEFNNKGYSFFFEVAELVRRQVKNVEFIATGEFQNKPPGITFPGKLTRDKLKKLLADSRCLVFPSVWDEPFGKVVVEAMAVGTPVVAFENGNIENIITDGNDGFLVPSLDSRTMADRVIELLKDSGLATEMGANSRKKIEDKFAYKSVLRKLTDLTASLLLGETEDSKMEIQQSNRG